MLAISKGQTYLLNISMPIVCGGPNSFGSLRKTKGVFSMKGVRHHFPMAATITTEKAMPRIATQELDLNYFSLEPSLRIMMTKRKSTMIAPAYTMIWVMPMNWAPIVK